MRQPSFITTKAPGSGTGLGLSVVHGIMQSHDGYAATLTASAVKALGIRALALKPLNLETLGRSVHQILTAPSDPDRHA